MSTQEQLFPDFPADRRAAIEADVDTGGGLQVVGYALGLGDDPIAAGKILSNRIKQNGRHRLTDEDVWTIRQLARQKTGISRLHELESSALNFEGRWLTTQDLKLRRKKQIAHHMTQLQSLLAQDAAEISA